MRKILLLILVLFLINTISAAQIFFDGFESGGLSGWTLTSASGANNWTASTTDPYQGTYHAQSQPMSTTEPASVTQRVISTLGYNNIVVNYSRKLVGIDGVDEFQLEWFDGTSWTILEQTGSNPADDTTYLSRQYTLSSLADNNANFQIKFECTAGATSEYCRVDNVNITGDIIISDSTPPSLSIIYPQNTTYNINISSLNYSVSDANLQACWYSLNNGITNTTITCGQNATGLISTEGSNTWKIWANDSAGNTNSSSITFFKDTINPLIDYGTGTANSSAYYNRNWIFVNVSVTEINFKNLTYYLYNATGLVNSTTYTTQTFSINFTSLTDGNYSINATIYDVAGNLNSTSTRSSIVLDTQGPTITISYPLNGYSYAINNISINWSVSDNLVGLSSCWWTNNLGVTNISIICGQNFTQNLSDGTYTYKIYSNDSLNNLGSASTTFTISTGPPAINLNFPLNNQFFNTGTNIYFNFTATDNDGLSTCELWGNWTGVWGKNHTWVKPNSEIMNFTTINLTEGNYIWNIWCNDTLNQASFSANNRTLNVDLTKPSVINSNYQPAIIYNGTNVYIYGNITDLNLNTVWIEINHSGAYQNITVTSFIENTYNYSLSSSLVSNFENISWKWWANDSAGNSNSSLLSSFMITNRNPYNITIINKNNSFINSDSWIINFSSVDDDGDTINYTLYNSSEGILFSVFSSTTNNFINFTGYNNTDRALTYYYITANDSKLQNQSDIYMFTIDKTNPSLILTEPTGTKSSRINIPLTFSVSDSNLGSCIYNVFSGASPVVSNTSVNCSSGSTTFSVSTDGDFILSFYANDSAGNSNFSNLSFSVSTSGGSSSSSSSSSSSGGGGGGGIFPTTPKIVSGVNRLEITELSNLIVNPGDTKKLTLNVRNSGTNFLNECKLIPKGTISTWVSSNEIKNLASGEEYEFSFNLNTPKDVKAGSYAIGLSLECKETSKDVNFNIEIIEKKIGLNLIKVERVSNEQVKVIYSLEELSNSEQNVELQFLLFDSDNEKVADIKDSKKISASSKKNFEILIPIDSSLNGQINLLINLNSESYSTFVQESIILGSSSISGFSIFGDAGDTENIVSVIFVVLFLVFAFFMIKRIIKHKQIIKGKKLIKKKKKKTGFFKKIFLKVFSKQDKKGIMLIDSKIIEFLKKEVQGKDIKGKYIRIK